MGQPPCLRHRPDPRPEIRRVGLDTPPPGGSGYSTSETVGLDTVGRAASASRTRPVCFDAAEGYVDTPVIWRPDLAPGVRVRGPAIIEEFGSTVPIHPGFAATVDAYLNLVVTRSHDEQGGGA